jgi:hypothetical protein
VKIEIAPPPEVPNIQQSNFRLGISHASKFWFLTPQSEFLRELSPSSSYSTWTVLICNLIQCDSFIIR